MVKTTKPKSVQKPKVGIENEAGVSPPDARIYTDADDVPDSIWRGMFNTQLNIINKFSDAALMSEHLAEDQKDILRWSIGELSAVTSRVLERSGADCTKNDALEFMLRAFTVGVFSTPTPTYMEELVAQAESKRMRDMRLVNSSRVKQRRQIIQKRTKRKLINSLSCASLVRDDCMCFFVEAGIKEVNVETIKRDIAAILKAAKGQS